MHSSLAFLVSLIGASSVIATLMEGVRRANDLPVELLDLLAAPPPRAPPRSALAYPLRVATILVVFGHFITDWLAVHIMPSDVQTSVYVVALLIRWSVALTGSIGIIGLIYHMGTPMQQSWKRVLPGAFLSTAMWFLTTLVFGWYVTRFANYSQVYGSLGAGIALLFWLYIISLCVLYGAEFNAEFHARVFAFSRDSFLTLPHKYPPARLELATELKLTSHPIRKSRW